jgi:uncharacterized membrane protein YgcG
MGKTRVLKLLAVILTSVFSLVFTPQISHAGVDDFEFKSMDVRYELSLGEYDIAQLKVTETLVAVFPETDQNRGIRRLIPDFYQDHSLATNIISVTDENGAPRDFTVEYADGYVNLVSKHSDDRFVHFDQTYVITYSQRWVIANYGDTDEFYWDVNGTGWAQPFGSVSATVVVAPELSDALLVDEISCYQGAQGESAPCDEKQLNSTMSSTSVEFKSAELAAGQTLTIVLPFTAGVVNTGSVSQVTGTVEYALLWVLGASILALLIWSVYYRIVHIGGRKWRKFITVQYEGPQEPDLAVVAQVIGSQRWQAALLMQAAVLGYVTLAEEGGTWLVTRTDKKVVEPNLQQLLGALLVSEQGGDSVGASVRLGAAVVEPESGRIAAVFNEHMALAVREGLDERYYSHFAVKTTFLSWLPIFGVTVGMAFVAASLDARVDAGFVLIPILLGFVASIAHAIIMLSKRQATQAGVELSIYMRGLSEFIRLVEKDRLAFLQSPDGAARAKGPLGQGEVLHLYEQVLPWAVLLGLETEWTKVLSLFYTDQTPPNYVPLAFIHSSSIASLNSAIAASFASSSSSGSGGGGSAGGGGGGGGGSGV